MRKPAPANRVATAACVLVQIAVNGISASGSLAAQESKPGNGGAVSESTSDQNQLKAGVQDAIFRDRQQLLKFLGERKTRTAICTPAPNDSYDEFQVSIQEKLDVLWNLDIYAAKYGLTKQQHRDVKACAAQMEKYQDNFELWQELLRVH